MLRIPMCIFDYWREFQKTFITFVTPKIANHTHNITAPHYQHKLFDQSYKIDKYYESR